MLKRFKADLHLHTCLSPCSELDMTPSAIVRSAIEKGIDIVAVTDHNSAENVTAAKKASEGTQVTVLAGMEIASSEEAHVLALFNEVESIIRLQDIVYKNLLPGENDEKLFGEQVVVNEKNEVLDFNKRLLIGATSLSAHDIVRIVRSLGGLSIASHVDRDAFSIISQLGFIPEELEFDALEISDREKSGPLLIQYNTYSFITSSDAHDIKDIGKRTTVFLMKEPTVEEMRLAFKNIDGRKVEREYKS